MNNVNARVVSSKVCTAERTSPHEKRFSSEFLFEPVKFHNWQCREEYLIGIVMFL